MTDNRSKLVIKRIYLPPAADDGHRVLVDRLWPRGVSRREAAVDVWLKDVAPSAALRKWFGHDAAKWDEFRKRYLVELAGNGAVAELQALAQSGPTTLLYGAHDEAHNQARVLLELLKGKRHAVH